MRHLSENLEQLVKERTQELSEKSGLLESEVQERKLAERESLALKNRLQSIFDAMPLILIGIDTDGRITQWNKTAEKISGKTAHAAIGAGLTAALDLFDLADETVLAAVNTFKPIRQRVLIGGQRHYYDINTYPFRALDSVGKVICIDDVTTQIVMEQELFKAEKLQAIGVLAGGIAHDFNNLLGSILGYISLSLLAGNDHEKNETYLRRAEDACLKAKALTQQLLTFSKGGEPVKEASGLAHIIQEATAQAVTGKSIDCQFAFPEDLWSVHIDRGQIGQIGQNIVLNACQAMTEGGALSLSCTNLTAGADQRIKALTPGPYVRIEITDSGPGIPSDQLDKIFDPYYSTKPDGNGLGLSICFSIMEKHNGHIRVESAPGDGTTFYLYLPALETTASMPRPPSVRPVTGSKPVRMLVMDDDDMIREVIGTMLEKLGHSVIYARDGTESIARYQQALERAEPIDLVFMDLMVNGGMGGKEAVAEILKIDPKAKVVVSSGYSDDPILANYAAYGFVGAIAKPFALDNLMDVVATVLS